MNPLLGALFGGLGGQGLGGRPAPGVAPPVAPGFDPTSLSQDELIQMYPHMYDQGPLQPEAPQPGQLHPHPEVSGLLQGLIDHPAFGLPGQFGPGGPMVGRGLHRGLGRGFGQGFGQGFTGGGIGRGLGGGGLGRPRNPYQP